MEFGEHGLTNVVDWLTHTRQRRFNDDRRRAVVVTNDRNIFAGMQAELAQALVGAGRKCVRYAHNCRWTLSTFHEELHCFACRSYVVFRPYDQSNIGREMRGLTSNSPTGESVVAVPRTFAPAEKRDPTMPLFDKVFNGKPHASLSINIDPAMFDIDTTTPERDERNLTLTKGGDALVIMFDSGQHDAVDRLRIP